VFLKSMFHFIYKDDGNGDGSKHGSKVSKLSYGFRRQPLNICGTHIPCSRFGIGTRPRDVRIAPVIFTPAEPLPPHTTLSVEDLSKDMGEYGGQSKWYMFTLTGIGFIQSNGLANAKNFENLTKSIFSEGMITRELLTILELSISDELLIPDCRWNQILANCRAGRVV